MQLEEHEAASEGKIDPLTQPFAVQIRRAMRSLYLKVSVEARETAHAALPWLRSEIRQCPRWQEIFEEKDVWVNDKRRGITGR